jgi:stage II sporulation protein D
MRSTVLLTSLVATAAVAAPAIAAPASASAAATLTINGAGFGHGIGMSQYGAAGYAAHGWDHAQILAHYFTGTQLDQTDENAVVRVQLQASVSTARFTAVTNAGTRKLDAAKTYGASSAAGGRVNLLDAGGRTIATFDPPLRVTNSENAPVKLLGTAANGVPDGTYRGWLELRPAGSRVMAINAVGLEQYVAGVVANEAIPSWPAEALAAQAVAARTYAITTSRATKDGWDQYADTRSQVYRGVVGENANTNKAVNATAGQVVTYDGQPITTYFFSTSGGRTESIENVWPGATPQPYLVSVDDPYDTISPYHRWGPIRIPLQTASAKLGSLVKGRFKGIKVTRRGGSPRIVEALVVGTDGTTTVTGAQLQRAFALRDTWMSFNATTAVVETPDDGAGGANGGSTTTTTTPTTTTTTTTPPKGSSGGGSSAGGASPGRTARRTGRSSRATPRDASATRVRLTRPRVTGSAFPARSGTRVLLQRRVGSRWVRAGATHLGTTHRYKVSLPGPGRYRIVVGDAPGPIVRLR